jgi:hypothetical protein
MGIAALALAAGPLIFMGIAKNVDMFEMNASVGAFIIKLALLAFVSLGPGFLLAGLVFPLTISWLAEAAGDGDGKRLGWLLAVNGLGGVVGAETAYRILLPLFDVHTALGVVAISYGLAALALSFCSQRFNNSTIQRQRPRRVLWIASHAVVVAAVALSIPGLRALPLVSKRFGIRLLDHFGTRRVGRGGIRKRRHGPLYCRGQSIRAQGSVCGRLRNGRPICRCCCIRAEGVALSGWPPASRRERRCCIPT